LCKPYDFLCTLGIPEKIEDAIEKFRESGNLNLANEYSQVWNAVMEVFDHTVEVMGMRPLELRSLPVYLKSDLENAK